jgi:hypothetical protein
MQRCEYGANVTLLPVFTLRLPALYGVRRTVTRAEGDAQI